MRVAVLAEYVQHSPASPSRRVLDIARGLSARGHEVTLCTDGMDDERDAAPIHTIVLDPNRSMRQLRIGRFLSSAAALKRTHGFDRVISTTHLWEGDVWVPLGPPSLAFASALVRRIGRPAPIAMFVLSRPWLARAAWVERAVRARATPIKLPPASALAPLTSEEREAARARLRDVLGVSGSTPIVVSSVVHAERPGLDAALRTLASSVSGSEAPVLVLLGFGAWRLRGRAVAAGVESVTRPLGVTWSMRDVLAGADLALASQREPGAWAMGRFVSDAARCGLPVLAAREAPGAASLDPEAAEIVDADEGWALAWSRVFAGPRLDEMRAAAARAADRFGLGPMLDALETGLTLT